MIIHAVMNCFIKKFLSIYKRSLQFDCVHLKYRLLFDYNLTFDNKETEFKRMTVLLY